MPYFVSLLHFFLLFTPLSPYEWKNIYTPGARRRWPYWPWTIITMSWTACSACSRISKKRSRCITVIKYVHKMYLFYWHSLSVNCLMYYVVAVKVTLTLEMRKTMFEMKMTLKTMTWHFNLNYNNYHISRPLPS